MGSVNFTDWSTVFTDFCKSGFDCAGWFAPSTQKALSIAKSARRSSAKPEDITVIRRGTVVYIIREDYLPRHESYPELADGTPDFYELSVSFDMTDYHFAGYVLPTIGVAKEFCAMADETELFESDRGLARINRAVWVYRTDLPREDKVA